MKRLTLTLALALLAASPASALGQDTTAPRIVMQFTGAGDPQISVEYSDSAALEALRRCPPDAACETLPLPARRGHWVGETPAGTVFEADIRVDGDVSTVRSVPWQGRVTATSPPSLVGDAKVGGTVTGQHGTWSGGWGERPGRSPNSRVRDFTGTAVMACRTRERTDCWYPPEGPLAQRWAGSFLFAASWRGDGEETSQEISIDYGESPWSFPGRASVADKQTSAFSAPVQVCCTPPAPAADPVPAPKASLRSRALRRNGRLWLGRVECTLRCSVGLIVSGGGRTLTRSRTVEGPATLSIPPRRGRLTVRVKVDGKLLVRGHVRAR